jgi:hypothetical protein
MRPPDDRDLLLWAVVIGGAAAYDVWADRNRPHGTLTHVTKHLFRLETSEVGRAALVGLWGGLTYWLLPHLMRRAATAVETVREELTPD